ncbi:PhzF family phenazine biosynthesis protein [Variovorax sp. VNK109]|uniref:PhzF family phenazine biosynthesis protein n=1 Tax=Variovorax sp. VNK109 TaxID=3400919 RepID=UPI003C0B8854
MNNTTSARQRNFRQVDVFTATPYFGNPVAVVLDGDGLDADTMQRFAQWTNLSETTFLLPPTQTGADYRVRIFTPGGELPFAGHPTLGSCHAWLEAGGQPAQGDFVTQECAIGLVRIRRNGSKLAFAAPPLKRSNPSPAVLAQVAGALGLKAKQVVASQVLDNGPVWFGLLVDSAQTVLSLDPDHAQLKALGYKAGVANVGVAAADDSQPGVVVRAFAAPIGVNEDPVTGSFNASLAQWLMGEGLAPERYLASQGERLGRAGRVHVERDAQGQVWVGGESVSCIGGQVRL